jgi:outer membrane lipoprotein-sorting protein
LGSPAQTVAVRSSNELFVVYPKLKRAEKYPLKENQAGPWKDALLLLEAGFPRNAAELESRFRIVEEKTTGTTHEIRLEPRSVQAKKMIPEIRIGFSLENQMLLSTELKFSDGSSMRNDFFNSRLNPPLEAGVFTPPIDPDTWIVEPLQSR